MGNEAAFRAASLVKSVLKKPVPYTPNGPEGGKVISGKNTSSTSCDSSSLNKFHRCLFRPSDQASFQEGFGARYYRNRVGPRYYRNRVRRTDARHYGEPLMNFLSYYCRIS